METAELLINCVGGAAEATAEQCFEALDPQQKQAVNDHLLPLVDQHAAFLARLEQGVANQNASVQEVTDLVRAMLKQQPDLLAEYKRFGGGLKQLAQTLNKIQEQLQALHAKMHQEFRDIHRRFDDLDRKPKSPYWISIHDEQDVLWLRNLYAESRTWPPEKRRALRPERFAALLIEANQPEQASAICLDAVDLCPVPAEQAGLLLRKMRADLERQQGFQDALEALKQAIRLDPARAPFPAGEFEPLQILGVGGAGMALRCRNCYGAEVVVKCLHHDGLDRKPEDLFREIPVLHELANQQCAAIVRVQYGRYTDAVTRRGPYIVMDYFPGESLQKYLDRTRQGLAQPDFLAVAMPVARALQAAHLLGIYHRDVKPDNVLLGQTPAGWDVRLIDFGLAVKCEVARNSQVAPRKSLQGLAAAGTADFAAPEQMGKRDDKIGPWSDVYGFGRFCCYTLFRTPTPLFNHWRSLPDKLVELINRCLQEVPADRYQGFEPILALLVELQQPRDQVPCKPKLTETVTPHEAEILTTGQDKSEQHFTNSVGMPGGRKPKGLLSRRTLLGGAACVSLTVVVGGSFWFTGGRASHHLPTMTNSIGMDFVSIKPGRFQMGSPGTEHQHQTEETQHRVTLTNGFYLQTTLVTQQQWKKVMGGNPSNFKGDDLPVENVNWFDAVEFCIKLSAKENKKPRYQLVGLERGKEGSIESAKVTILTAGNGYRLPTEAEWEYACRAGTTTPFWLGETITTKQVNFDGNYPYLDMDSKGEYRQKTTPVKQFKANPWDLHDMHGNLWQWCDDWYGDYPNMDIKDPQGPDNGTSRVLRGGSWDYRAVNCRAANRIRNAPAYRSGRIGFRVALRLD